MKTPLRVWKHDWGRIILALLIPIFLSIVFSYWSFLFWTLIWTWCPFFLVNFYLEVKWCRDAGGITWDTVFDTILGFWGLPVSLVVVENYGNAIIALLSLATATIALWAKRSPRMENGVEVDVSEFIWKWKTN